MVALSVCARLGVHFFSQIIQYAINYQFRAFYKELHTGWNQPICDNYIAFTASEYPAVSEYRSSSVKKTFTHEVLNYVADVAAEYFGELKKLIALMKFHYNICLSKLGWIMGFIRRQSRWTMLSMNRQHLDGETVL
ncbi:hypothetical protein DPMN_054453 [Dreissena polymorpha]|uniref:Uncharacterized protein n=1 Tax=Dreissena polymorpha TaxID=45954 RepID=A0A9D4CQQ5_DREPO|nr:hypothetical protein DPMN_054453 [Dreissena polymorpha]